MVPESDATTRLDEILVEILEAEDQGDPVDPAAWSARYPDLRAELEEFFAAHTAFARARDVVPDTPIPQVHGYTVVRELGRGGSGVVFEARQHDPDRAVALKALVGARLLTPVERVRFRREARVAAQLDHPNILPVYETGEVEGVPFFTMKLAAGGPLSRALDRYRADPPTAARLTADLARAIHFAHQRGILHRDLKPSNILLDDAGRGYVSDFGLVRDLADPDPLTRTRDLIGTVPYLPPESTQSGGPCTVAVDVYGLGCVLYAALTGRAPFEGKSDADTLLMVRRDPPAPAARVNPLVPRDLGAICGKCLEKDPAARYASAAALADDLDAFLGGRPTVARPPGPGRRVIGWARRHPALSAVAGLLAAFLVAASAGAAVHQAELSAVNADLFAANESLGDVNQALGEVNVELTQKNADLDAERKRLAEVAAALRKQIHGDQLRTAALLLEGFARDEAARVLAEALPEEQAQGGPSFAWRYLKEQTEPEFATLEVPFREARAVAFSPDGDWLAVGDQFGAVQMYEYPSLQPGRRLTGLVGVVTALAFDPGHPRLIGASEYTSPVCWAYKSGKPVRLPPIPPGGALDVAWGRDGTIVAVLNSGTAAVWKIGTKQARTVPLVQPGDKVKVAAAFPDTGVVVVTTEEGGRSVVVELADGRAWPLAVRGFARRLRRMPDDRAVVQVDSGAVQVAAPACPDPVPVTVGGDGSGYQVVAGSAKGLVAGGSMDGVLTVWTLELPNAPVRAAAHTGKVRDLAFHPDGDVLASAGADGKVRLWNAALLRRRQYRKDMTAPIRSLAYNPARPAELVIGASDQIVVRLPAAGRTLAVGPTYVADGLTDPGGSGSPRQLAVSADGSAIFAAVSGGSLARYRQDSRELRVDWRSDPDVSTSGVGLAPDGQTVWSKHKDDRVRRRDAGTGREVGSWGVRDSTGPVAVHPNGEVLAVRSFRGLAHVIDARTGSTRASFEGNGRGSDPLAFSPDGRVLAVAEGPAVVLWDWESGKRLHSLTDRGQEFSALAFTPDGLELATGTLTGSIVVWRVSSGQRLLSFPHPGTTVTALAFHPKGDALATAVTRLPSGTRADLTIRWASPIPKPKR